MPDFAAYASIILDVSLDKVLDYGILLEQMPLLKRGMRVEVPVRNRLESGYVLEVKKATAFNPVKPISAILSPHPLISDDLFELAQWMSRYYCTPLRSIFKMFLPPGVRQGMAAKQQWFVSRGKSREEMREFCIELRVKNKASQVAILDKMLQVQKGLFLSQLLEETKISRSTVETLEKKGWLKLEKVHVDRSVLQDEEYFPTKAKLLNAEQADALHKMTDSLRHHRFETHLLYGVTGSGKTEVYLQAIECALSLDLGTIMLVPEISLTGQTIERFRSRFQEKIAILHHRLSEGERHDEWQHIHSGRAKIVIGARSAIFSPVVNLGLIIVDEEHEQSYKQNDISPCYHARDVAVMRGKLTQSTVILGSATPSLESYYNAQKGKYHLSVLSQRADTALLPTVTIVDMKREYDKAKGITIFSDALLTKIKSRKQKGEQTILFLNRRGYHTVMICLECSQSIKCLHCDLPMTFHLNHQHLACHLCGYKISPPTKCPSCQGGQPLKFRGIGTEQVEKTLRQIFPDIRTLRMDADTTKHKGSHQKLLREFGTGKADVLIGTQMIAKGLHFPEVTLVGILNSDSSLNIPDFRASETVFQLLTQVAGRAGRGIIKGEVIIQTALVDNPTIQHAAKQDYIGFYQEEIAIREFFRYPPFTQMAKITFSGPQAQTTLEVAEKFRTHLAPLLPAHTELHPVIPCGYAKVKDHYRYQFLIRGPQLSSLHASLQQAQQKDPWSSTIKMFIDVNPSSTFF